MKIGNIVKDKYAKFGTLKGGDVFLYDTTYYIKLYCKIDSYNSVNLQTGEVKIIHDEAWVFHKEEAYLEVNS